MCLGASGEAASRPSLRERPEAPFQPRCRRKSSIKNRVASVLSVTITGNVIMRLAEAAALGSMAKGDRL